MTVSADPDQALLNPAPAPAVRIPVLALVGRPNVGKSTLFNRLTRTRKALVAPIPGVTRDRRELDARFEDFRFRLVDTGGMSFTREAAFSEEIAAQVAAAIASADLVWLVLDAADGLNPFDAEMYRLLQKQGKPVVVVANKTDSPARQHTAGEFYALGTQQVYSISGLHGTGLRAAFDGSAALIPNLLVSRQSEARQEDMPVRIAFVGKPNAGKSSLVNRILGTDRQIVSDIAGTTREAVEIPFEAFGERYVLVDTAGIRRRARTTEYLEKISVINALSAMDLAEVVVLVLDASEPPAEQDARIAGYILEKGRGLVVAMNKWDLVLASERKPQDVEADVAHALRFVEFAPRVRISATSGQGMERLFKDARIVAKEFAREIQTADLNRVVQVVTRQTPPPAKGKSASKIHYGTQTSTRPPTFRFFANHPESIPASYTRFMEHQLRYHFGFRGVSIGINWSGKGAVDAAGEPIRSATKRVAAKPHASRTGGKPAAKPQGKLSGKPTGNSARKSTRKGKPAARLGKNASRRAR